MDKQIMCECFADTLLIETLVPTEIGYNHKHGCAEVARTMMSKFGDRFALGIIDKDKRMLKYLGEFKEIDSVNSSLYLFKHKNQDKHHYFIQISPALEQWILNICNLGKINLRDFELMDNLPDLKKYTKSRSSSEDKSLKGLYTEISRKEDLPEVRKIKTWISLLKEKNYRVQVNELKNG